MKQTWNHWASALAGMVCMVPSLVHADYSGGGYFSPRIDTAAIARDRAMEAPPVARIIEQLRHGPAADRAEFARIALLEMTTEYSAELEVVQEQLRNDEGGLDRPSLARWSQATQDYVAYLEKLYQTTQPTTDVQLWLQTDGRLRLIIGTAQVMVSGPRIEAPLPFENQVIASYCFERGCDYEPIKTAAHPIRQSAGNHGVWNFGDGRGAIYSTHDGLNFEFRNMSQRYQKEAFCIAIVAELRTLLEKIKFADDKGVPINWDHLHLRPELQGSSQYRLVFNRLDDHLAINLPTLSRAPDLWRRSLPWLKAHSRGRHYEHVFHNAETLRNVLAR